MTKKHKETPSAVQEEAVPAENTEETTGQNPQPTSPAASPEVDALIKDLAAAQSQRDEYLGGWQRSIAEFANYKKRVERDREQTQQNMSAAIIKRYLEIADDLERALKARPGEGEGAAWSNGIELIYRKLIAILDSQGAKPIAALGQPFDPNQHEAIGQMETNAYPSGHVAEVVQTGYSIGERVLRPAIVRIAS